MTNLGLDQTSGPPRFPINVVDEEDAWRKRMAVVDLWMAIWRGRDEMKDAAAEARFGRKEDTGPR